MKYTEQEVKALLWDGHSVPAVQRMTGFGYNELNNIKVGRRANGIAWPDGSKGAMPIFRQAMIAEKNGYRGISNERQQEYRLLNATNNTAGDLTEETTGVGQNAGEKGEREEIDRVIEKAFAHFGLPRDTWPLDLQNIWQSRMDHVLGNGHLTIEDYRVMRDTAKELTPEEVE